MLSTALNTLNVEQSKFFIRRPFWISVSVISVVLLLAFIIVQVTTDNSIPISSDTTWAQAGAEISRGFAQLVVPLVLVLAGAFIGMEYGWRTLSLTLGRGTPRSVFLGAKLLVIFGGTLLLMLLSDVLVGGGVFLNYSLLGQSPSLSQFHLGAFSLSFGRSFITFLPYIGLTVFLTVVARSSAVGIGGGLAFTLLLETLLAFALGFLNADLTKFLPTTLAHSFLTANSWSGKGVPLPDMGTPAVEPTLAAFGLIAWATLFIYLSLAVFRRQDLNA